MHLWSGVSADPHCFKHVLRVFVDVYTDVVDVELLNSGCRYTENFTTEEQQAPAEEELSTLRKHSHVLNCLILAPRRWYGCVTTLNREMSEELRKTIIKIHVKGKGYLTTSEQLHVPLTRLTRSIKFI